MDAFSTRAMRALLCMVIGVSGLLSPNDVQAGISCYNAPFYNYARYVSPNGTAGEWFFTGTTYYPECERTFDSGTRGWGNNEGPGGRDRPGGRDDELDGNDGEPDNGLLVGLSPGQSCPAAGNPIVLSTGNKIEPEQDFGSSGEMALHLVRTYNHYWQGAGIFGKHWISNFDYKLSFGTTDLNACYPRPGGGTCSIGSNTLIYAWRPDGRTIKYIKNAADGVFYEDKPGPISKIVKQTDGSFILYGEDNLIEKYSSAGYVAYVQDEHGLRWTYAYNGTYPTRVTHTSTRYVEFTWTNGQLTAVRDPANNYHGYSYTASTFGTGLHRLAAASRPGAPATAITYHYEIADKGALTGKSFNGQRYSTFGYNASGYAIRSEHSGQDRNTFTYSMNASGLLTTVHTNPLGKQTTFTFQDGKPRSVTGHASTYCPVATYAETTYDGNGYPQLKSDNEGNDTHFTYNSKGQLTQKIEAYGTSIARKTAYVWDASKNRITSVTVGGVSSGSELVRTETTYTSDNRISTVSTTNLSTNGVTGQSRTTTYTYTEHANGMLKTVTEDGPLDGAGDAIVKSYSSFGDLISVENSLGHAVIYSNHNGLGLPERVTGMNGEITDYTYDARGRVTKERRYPNGTTVDTLYAYNDDGLLASVTTPDGVKTHAEYDVAHRITKRYIDSTGVLANNGIREEQRYGYNSASDLVRTETYSTEGHYETQFRFTCLQPRGAPQHECHEPEYVPEEVWVVSPVLKQSAFTDYDELSRPRASRGNDGQNVRYTYDDNGNIKTITDSLNRVTTLHYDALDRVAKSVDAKLKPTEFEYDAGDRLVWVKDPRGLITTYIYDGFGQLWSQTSPDTGTTTYAYNAGGQRTSLTRNDGSSLSFTYGDSLGRLTMVSAPGVARDYYYDDCPNSTNSVGRLCKIHMRDPNAILSHSLFYYFPYGQLQARHDAGSGANDITRYAYDSMGRLTKLTYPSGIAANYGYSQGKLTSLTATIGANTFNIATNIQYQPFGPAKSWAYGNGLARSNNYDLDGRLTGISTTAGATVTQSLTYAWNANDLIEAVTNGVDADQSHSYQYDELSRLTRDAYPGNSTVIADGFDAVGNRVTRTRHDQGSLTAELTYPIEADSNQMLAMNGSTNRNFVYNARGHLASSSGWLGNRTYVYDGFDRLKSTTVDGATTSYLINALDQRVAKTGPLGTRRYVYAGQNTLLGEHIGGGLTGWTNYLYLHGQPVALVSLNNVRYFLHTDHLGRPEVMTDTAKTPKWKAANGTYSRTVTLGSGVNIGFPGQVWDEETDTWYNGFRDYDPYTGRYLQSDPIGLAGGVNTYAYVGGNPVSFIDPLGLQGHHYVPRQIINRYNFSPSARSVFENGTTGRVQHYFDRGHRSYNQAVGNLVDDFLKKNNIDPSKMTRQQAQQCLDEVKNSQQEDIRNYLDHLGRGGGLFRPPVVPVCVLCEIFGRNLPGGTVESDDVY